MRPCGAMMLAGLSLALAGCGTGFITSGMLGYGLVESEDGQTAAFLTGEPKLEPLVCVLAGKELCTAPGTWLLALSRSGRTAVAQAPAGDMAFTLLSRSQAGMAVSTIEIPAHTLLQPWDIRCTDEEVWVELNANMTSLGLDATPQYWKYSLAGKTWQQGTEQAFRSQPESLRVKPDCDDAKMLSAFKRFRLRSGRVLESKNTTLEPGQTRCIEPDGQIQVLLRGGIGRALLNWGAWPLAAMGIPMS
ncbi:MAG: hypothetical protein NTV86_21055 [Planctomycetota bacterium]|nr:hypothetical protein [Planctomycetota bacterium]